MRALEKIGAKVVSQLVLDMEYGWPPDCIGLVYQPERPSPTIQTLSDNNHSDESNIE